MDLTYRNGLRALNDTNFARFEAVLEARLATAHLQLETRFARLDARFAQLEARWDMHLAREELLVVQRTLVRWRRWLVSLWMTSMLGILTVLVTLLRQG